MKLGKDAQMALAVAGYSAVQIGILWHSLASAGVAWSIPVVMMLAGTLPCFAQAMRGIAQDDPAARKMAFSKIKTLWFLCVVVMVVHRLLSGGIGGVKFG